MRTTSIIFLYPPPRLDPPLHRLNITSNKEEHHDVLEQRKLVPRQPELSDLFQNLKEHDYRRQSQDDQPVSPSLRPVLNIHYRRFQNTPVHMGLLL